VVDQFAAMACHFQPTGSTGYSMAAVDRILHPGSMPLWSIRICPMSLSSRPWWSPRFDLVVLPPGEASRRGELWKDGAQPTCGPGERCLLRRCEHSA